MTRSTSGIVDNFARIGLAVQGVKTVFNGLKSLVSVPLSLAAGAESTATSFEVMTGSVDVATKLIKDLKAQAASTPFEFVNLSGATETLLAFSRPVETVLDDLDMLSNVASGNAEKLKSLSMVFGQISSAGKLMGGDLLQLIGQGFNPLTIIAENTGETMSDLKDRMSKGLVTFEEVREAFKTATSAGGQFYQMNEKQSKTLNGLWSTLKDGVNAALLEMGQQIASTFDLKEAISSTISLVSTITQQLLPVMKSLFEIGKVVAQTFYDLRGVWKILVPIILGIATAMMVVVVAQKAVIAAQTLVLALSGPKGWAQIAAGLAIAGAATLVMSKQMNELADAAKNVKNATTEQAKGIEGIGKAAEKSKKKVKELTEHQKMLKSRMENQGKFNDFRRSLVRGIGLESGKTELDFKLDEFKSVGFERGEVDRLRELSEKLDELKTKNKELADLESFAKSWTEKLKTPADLYQEELTKLQQAMTNGFLSTDQFDAAKAKLDEENKKNLPDTSPSQRLFQSAEFGSQAARSAIIRNKMNGSVNKDEKDIKDATKKQASLMEDYVEDFAEFKRDFYGSPTEEFAI